MTEVEKEKAKATAVVGVGAGVGGASGATVGVLELVLGKQRPAWAHFQEALLLPDRMMSHHLTRIAMDGTGLPH